MSCICHILAIYRAFFISRYFCFNRIYLSYSFFASIYVVSSVFVFVVSHTNLSSRISRSHHYPERFTDPYSCTIAANSGQKFRHLIGSVGRIKKKVEFCIIAGSHNTNGVISIACRSERFGKNAFAQSYSRGEGHAIFWTIRPFIDNQRCMRGDAWMRFYSLRFFFAFCSTRGEWEKEATIK